jgi:hypothetical protein
MEWLDLVMGTPYSAYIEEDYSSPTTMVMHVIVPKSVVAGNNVDVPTREKLDEAIKIVASFAKNCI